MIMSGSLQNILAAFVRDRTMAAAMLGGVALGGVLVGGGLLVTAEPEEREIVDGPSPQPAEAGRRDGPYVVQTRARSYPSLSVSREGGALVSGPEPESVPPETLQNYDQGGLADKVAEITAVSRLPTLPENGHDHGEAVVTPSPDQSVPDDGARVVIVLDDMGVDKRRSKAAVALPLKVTLSYLAYAPNVATQAAEAKAAGHELMLHLPMEPESQEINPGPNVLLSGLPAADLRANIRWNLSRFSGYVGINNHMGSRFSKDAEGLSVLMNELKGTGIFFLDSVTTPKSVAVDVARKVGVPAIARHIFIDHEDDADAIARQLGRTVRIAKKNGLAIAIGHPRDKTLAALKDWLPGLARQGVELVPLKSVIDLIYGAGVQDHADVKRAG